MWDGVRFPDEITKNEDEYVFPAIMESSQRIYLTKKVVYNQVFTKHSITRSEYGFKNLFHAGGAAELTKYLKNKEYYDIALFEFGIGTRSIIDFNGVLKDEACQKEIKRLYKVFCKLAKELIPHVNFKTKMRLLLFRFSLKGYTVFQRKHAKIVAK